MYEPEAPKRLLMFLSIAILLGVLSSGIAAWHFFNDVSRGIAAHSHNVDQEHQHIIDLLEGNRD